MIFALPGGDFEAILEGAPTGLVGTVGVRLIDAPSGDIIIARYTSGIVEEPAGSGVYATEGELPDDIEIGDYLIVWDTVPGGTPLTPDDTFTEQLRVTAFIPSGEMGATFGSVDDVAARLGRELTPAEVTQASMLLTLSTLSILDAAGKDQAWAESLETFAPILRMLCVEATVRVMQNPSGLRSQQEQLGSYGHSETFINGQGVALTDNEARQVRRAIFGQGTASVRVGSLIDDCVVHSHFQSTRLCDTTCTDEDDEE